MNQGPLASVPWTADFGAAQPLYAPLAAVSERFRQFNDWPPLAAYNELARDKCLRTASGMPLTFVEAQKKPRRTRRRDKVELPYERQVFDRGEVQTRAAHWHDFFNMLVWATYPRIKAALNERQIVARNSATEPEVRAGRARNRELDRLTMFDEGGMLLVAPPGESEAWRIALKQSSPAALLRLASPFAVFVIGHAVFESLVHGNADVRSMTYLYEPDASFFTQSLDEQITLTDAAFALLIAKKQIFASSEECFGFPIAYLHV